MAHSLDNTANLPIGHLVDQGLKSGLRFMPKNGQLLIGGPSSQTELIAELARRQDELKPMFAPGPGDVVWIGEQRFQYFVWQGEQLKPRFALDTETQKIESPGIIPELAMVSASDGVTHCVIHPTDAARFIKQHAGAIVFGHNFAKFDFWVLQQHLEGNTDAQEVLWRMADEGRIGDSMLLDGLHQLALSDTGKMARGLSELSEQYTDLIVNKSDPCRIRYGSIIGKPWRSVPRMFFEYAAADAITSFFIYEELTRRAQQIVTKHDVDPQIVERYGLLSERIQVQGAIGLAGIEHNGLQIDRERLAEVRGGLEKKRDDLVKHLDAIVPDLFKRDKDGNLRRTASGTPSKSDEVLISIMESLATELELEPPRTAVTGQITKKGGYWKQFAKKHNFMANWLELEETSKLLSFVKQLEADRIHPQYNVLVRTGRTSCRNPNIQQIPRDGHLREAIVSPKGHSIYAVDYSSVELRTLATICEARYGHSRLGETIRAGVDPHTYVAAMFEGVDLEQFATQPNKKILRQRAKALNFGIPGGLGAQTLTEYAEQSYGVLLKLEEADRFRQRLITEVFPELAMYLSEDSYSVVAHQLNCDVADVRGKFVKSEYLGCMGRIVRGETTSARTGSSYSAEHIDSVWRALKQLNQNPELGRAIDQRDSSETTGLYGKLFGSSVATLSGRIRDPVRFTAARNTPFQGLAADGAKLALYALTRAGYRVVAFIHDEFLIELPDDADWIHEPKRIDAIICEAMSSVCNGFPIEVEGARVKRWCKEAEAVRDTRTGELRVWEPPDRNPEPRLEVPTPEPRETVNLPDPPAEDTQVRIASAASHIIPIHTAPRIFQGNCIEVGRALLESGERFNLVFGDPPFNIGHGYATYDDNIPGHQFQQFMHDWLDIGRQLLLPKGLLAMHGPDKLAYIAIRYFEDDPRHDIDWHFRFGQSGSVAKATKCTTSKARLLVYGDGNTTFHPPMVTSDRAEKYSDKRTQQTETPGQKVALDIWGLESDGKYWGRVQGNNKERWDKAHGALIDHPNQLPEVYVQRAIETFSNPGDRVLVMFGGSGTEIVVAHALDRQVSGIELGELECQSIIKRLERGPVRI